MLIQISPIFPYLRWEEEYLVPGICIIPLTIDGSHSAVRGGCIWDFLQNNTILGTFP